MRASVIVAVPAGGEGWLERTVGSCLEACDGLDTELIAVVAGPSSSGPDRIGRAFPRARVVPGDDTHGMAAAKGRAVHEAMGEVLIVLDGPARPEPGAVEQLISDVELATSEGVEALITPRVLALDPVRWQSTCEPPGHVGFLELETLDCGWLGLPAAPSWHHFYASSAALGGGLAISRAAYERLGGFDPDLLVEGLETLDLSLRCWLTGGWVLHDPLAAISHGFKVGSDAAVGPEHLLADELHLACKALSEATWGDWLRRCRRRHPAAVWDRAVSLFERRRDRVERRRAEVMARRRRDEAWYAAAFSLGWPNPAAGVHGVEFPEPPTPGSPRARRKGRSARACFEDHRRWPRNMGDLPEATLVGAIEDRLPGGITLSLSLLRLSNGEIIVQRAGFRGGDPEVRPYLSLLTDILEVLPLSQARGLRPGDLLEVFEADDSSAWAAELAIEALRKALETL